MRNFAGIRKLVLFGPKCPLGLTFEGEKAIRNFTISSILKFWFVSGPFANFLSRFGWFRLISDHFGSFRVSVRTVFTLVSFQPWFYIFFHFTSNPLWFLRPVKASTSSELYPDGFLLLAFAMTSLCFPFSFISFCFVSVVDFLSSYCKHYGFEGAFLNH